MTFKNEEAQRIAIFIEDHKADRILVSLIGRSKAAYVLSDNDKKAIIETLHFWILKKDIKTLEENIKKATIRIGKIKLLYNN